MSNKRKYATEGIVPSGSVPVTLNDGFVIQADDLHRMGLTPNEYAKIRGFRMREG